KGCIRALSTNAAEAQAALVVIEGVMGYYDGLAGTSYRASSYHVAQVTGTPAVLLVDGKGKSVSILAEIKGFLELEENSGIKGIILNRMTAHMYEEMKGLIEKRLPVVVLGYMPEMKDCVLESRHLGLVTAQEVGNLQEILEKMGKQCEKTLDLDALIKLANEASPLPSFPSSYGEKDTAIGIAMDPAFCFYYKDNLRLLEELGCRLIPFSPLRDKVLPPGIQGLYLGGGYPELHLPQLSENQTMRDSIKKAVSEGMPTIAECGGFMYLQEHIKDREGKAYPMVGAVEGDSFYRNKLVRFGYVTLTAKEDTLLCKKGETIKGHEFHYWDSTENGARFYAEKPLRNKGWDCVKGNKTLYAGYPHVHFASNENGAERFVSACREANHV
ncbi:MAG: cobyrinate a,c-diamide synthase, partial [Anaerovorax sp.]